MREPGNRQTGKSANRWGPGICHLQSAILLLGFGLMLYRLGFQAAVGDDAFSINIAGQGLAELLHLSANEPHPPVFYLLLWAWKPLAGDSEFSMRFVAVFWGVLALALIYRLGKRLAGEGMGILAALLLAINPFFLAYAQQARMYSMVVALSLASTWFFVQMTHSPARSGLPNPDPHVDHDSLHIHEIASKPPDLAIQREHMVWYLATTLLAVATHFFAFFILAFQNIVFLLLNWSKPRRLWPWLATQAAILLCYAPWVWVAYPTLSTYRNELVMQASLDQVLLRTLRVFALSETGLPPAEGLLLAGIVLLLAIGLVKREAWNPSGRASSGRSLERGTPLVAAYLFLPPVVVFLASLWRPMFFERYMMVVLPAYLLLLALGLAALARRSPWLLPVGLALPIMISASLLPGYYGEARYVAAADMRGMIGYLSALAKPDAAVVSNLPPSDPTYAYYYHGPWPLVYLPESGAVPPIPEQLADLAARHSEIWYLPYSAERAEVELWLDAHGIRVSHQWYGHAQLVRYAFPPAAPAMPSVSLKARFEQGINLQGYTLATPDVAAGQPILLTLYWQAEAKIAKPYKVFVHLLDGNEHLWGQQDIEPGSGLRPTNTWLPGQMVIDTYGILALPAAPAGEYLLAVGWYNPADGVRLKLPDGADRLLIGPVQVQ